MSSPSNLTIPASSPFYGWSLDDVTDLLANNLTVRYLNFAFVSMLLYDHCITWADEIDMIWTLRWKLPKVLFLINRYISPALLTFQFTVQAVPYFSRNFCRIYVDWQALPPRIALLTAEALVVIRVGAIYGNSKRMLGFLAVLFFGELAALVAMIVLGTQGTTLLSPSDPSPGCILGWTTPNVRRFANATWIAPVIFETIIMLLTANKIAPWNRPFNPILTILARDSLIYFAFMFVLSLANVALYTSNSDLPTGLLIGPLSILSCMAATRMMLNLRAFSEDRLEQKSFSALVFKPLDVLASRFRLGSNSARV